ncbi:MAG: HD domain-containing protein [Gammaproteobacteria bacterium]|nr:HD domain-containing protein [Gammaproteobacteria bacterium]MCP5200881.1 HD domain-containing protein [Gammaproteobacteria bacterium]
MAFRPMTSTANGTLRVCAPSQLGKRLATVHEQLAAFCPPISRVAVALLDPATDQLHSFLHSTRGDNPLPGYTCALDEVPSLVQIARARRARVQNDLPAVQGGDSEHGRRLLEAGYRASYTAPMFAGDRLLGFLFFDASARGVFTPPVCARVEVYAQLIALLVEQEQASIHTLTAAIRTAIRFGRFRDEETGAHLLRMSHYAHLIAHHLPGASRFDDERMEFLLLFAPLHDIGKIAIPDDILRKPGPLDADEMARMRTHVDHGYNLVRSLIEEFELERLDHIDMLRNIIRYHHENFDGSGYNAGLAGTAIPLEARIVKVADVFDALTSVRPYKRAWTLDEACAYLETESGRQFDPACAAALVHNRGEAAAIRKRFTDLSA